MNQIAEERRQEIVKERIELRHEECHLRNLAIYAACFYADRLSVLKSKRTALEWEEDNLGKSLFKRKWFKPREYYRAKFTTFAARVARLKGQPRVEEE